MGKALVVIGLQGGRDAFNFLAARDSTSHSAYSTARSSASANILSSADVITATGTLTKGSNVITGITTTGLGLANNMEVFSASLPAQRSLTIASFTTTTVTLSANAYITATETISFATPQSQLLPANDTAQAARKPAFHWSQEAYYDTFNTPDTTPNLRKIKSAVIACIGPIRKKTYKNGTTGTLFNLLVDDGAGGTRASTSADIPRLLTSHNDQQSTWQSNGPEGTTKGWLGGIADEILTGVASQTNSPLVSVSASGQATISVGSVANAFTISGSGLIRRFPGIDGKFTNETDPTLQANLTAGFTQAAQLTGTANDFMQSLARPTKLAVDYQSIFNNAQEITDPPTSNTFTVGGFSANSTALLRNFKQICRLILANNPNRGGDATRSGNTVTVVTEPSIGTAVRSGTAVTVTFPGHGLFTSNTSTTNLSDSVLITGLEASPPANGYKITLVPGEENDKFTLTTTESGTLTDVPVTIRLKHNLPTGAKVFITDAGFDSSYPVDGYPVTIVNNFTFTVTTTASGAFSPATKRIMFKTIDVPSQVIFTEALFSWDTHDQPNHVQQMALNHAYKYYISLVERMKNADVVLAEITEFGRTFGTNSAGTDHAWGGHVGVIGTPVRGGKIYGNLPDYSLTGADIISGGMIVPKTSVYQYGATFAKWLGVSDAKILELFPDLINWPLGERTLTFLDPLP